MTNQPETSAVAPAVGVSITTDVARGRQIVLQTYYPLDMPQADVDQMLDRMLLSVDRQKAIAELPELEDDLTKAERTLAQFREDLGMTDVRHSEAQARRAVERAEITTMGEREAERLERETKAEVNTGNAQVMAYINAAKARHTAEGRRGEWVARGADESRITTLREAVAKTEEHNKGVIAAARAKYAEMVAAKDKEIETADLERDQHLQSLNVSVKRFEVEIERLTGEIAKRRTIAKG
jgi:phage shock protein A